MFCAHCNLCYPSCDSVILRGLSTKKQPNNPTTQQPNNPTTQQPNNPTTQQPNNPTTQQPNNPTTNKQQTTNNTQQTTNNTQQTTNKQQTTNNKQQQQQQQTPSSSLARGRAVGKEVAEYMGPGDDAPGMEEVDKLIEEKVIRGREFILKHGLTELTLYSDRSHLYSQSSEKCWLLWMKDRRRYVRRVGCSWGWTGMLLTGSDSPVFYEEQVEQTLSACTMVKDLIWLLFDVPPDLEFQPGRANAACGHIHRMLKPGHLIIDDDDESWVTAKTGSSEGTVQDGGGQIRCMRDFPLNSRIFRHCTSFTWCSAGWVGLRLAVRGFFVPFVSDTRAGGRCADWVVLCLGHLL